jgi:outer membrane immunogenic protein
LRNPWILATASGVALAGAGDANAAPPVPVYTWTGFYVGVNAGAAFLHTKNYNLDDFGQGASGYTSPFFTSNGTGATYGAQFGYNWQMSQFVFGIEADLAALNASTTFTPPFNPAACGVQCPVTATNSISFLSTARARIGVAFGQFMVYGTGGAAFGKVSDRWGYPQGFAAAGGGIEYMVMPKVIIRLEALHVDLDTARATVTPTFSTTTFRSDFKHTANIGRLGLNFAW